MNGSRVDRAAGDTSHPFRGAYQRRSEHRTSFTGAMTMDVNAHRLDKAHGVASFAEFPPWEYRTRLANTLEVFGR
jgi:hypothetical protein